MKTLIVKVLCVAVLMVGGSSNAFASDTAALDTPTVSICHKKGSRSDHSEKKAGKHANQANHHRKHHHKHHPK
jgi:hypothetical protein